MNLVWIALVVLAVVSLVLVSIFKGRCGVCNKPVFRWAYVCEYHSNSGLGLYDSTLDVSCYHISCYGNRDVSREH